MANSTSKYTRARIRARGRRPQRRGGSRWFYGALAAIVVLGVVGVVLVRSGSSSAGIPPQPGDPTTGAPGDHWHAAFSANICGSYLSPPATFETASDNPNVRVGIHTHGDGFIHIHPFTKSEGGDNATLGKFFSYGGWSASSDSLSLWTGPTGAPNKKDYANGDKCPVGTPDAGKSGVVKWSLDCVEKQGNPSDLKLSNGTVIVLAFLPKAESIGTPPNATSTPQNDGSAASAPNAKTCATAGPGATFPSTSTTAAGASSATTTPSSTP